MNSDDKIEEYGNKRQLKVQPTHEITSRNINIVLQLRTVKSIASEFKRYFLLVAENISFTD
jgi:hypothetical protein